MAFAPLKLVNKGGTESYILTKWVIVQQMSHIGIKLMLWVSIQVGHKATGEAHGPEISWKQMKLATVMTLSFRTDRSRQTVQTRISLLLLEQSDQGLHCLLFNLNLFDEIPLRLSF